MILNVLLAFLRYSRPYSDMPFIKVHSFNRISYTVIKNNLACSLLLIEDLTFIGPIRTAPSNIAKVNMGLNV